MYLSAIFPSQQSEREFTHLLLRHLCEGRTDLAMQLVQDKLRLLDGHPVVELIRATQRQAPKVTNWGKLWRWVGSSDASGGGITAISIDVSWPGHYVDSSQGPGDPVLETNLYQDIDYGPDPVAFSSYSREKLAEYCLKGRMPWLGGFCDIFGDIGVTGLGTLNSAIWKLSSSQTKRYGPPWPKDFDAVLLGQSFIAIAVYCAVRRAVEEFGLPKPITVLLGSNDAPPFIHAPIISRDEYERCLARPDFPRFQEGPREESKRRARGSAREFRTEATRKKAEALKNLRGADVMKVAAVVGVLALAAARKHASPKQRELARALREDLKDLFDKRSG